MGAEKLRFWVVDRSKVHVIEHPAEITGFGDGQLGACRCISQLKSCRELTATKVRLIDALPFLRPTLKHFAVLGRIFQRIVADRIRPEADRDPYGVIEAERRLDVAYAMADRQAAKAPWAAGDRFSLADCAAAPALFYARVVRPFPAGADHLAAYAERLLDRPSVVRVIEEARPWFRYYPFADRLPARYRDPG